MTGKQTVIIKKSRKGTSIELKNIHMKPEDFHKAVEEGRKKAEGNENLG